MVDSAITILTVAMCVRERGFVRSGRWMRSRCGEIKGRIFWVLGGANNEKRKAS